MLRVISETCPPATVKWRQVAASSPRFSQMMNNTYRVKLLSDAALLHHSYYTVGIGLHVFSHYTLNFTMYLYYEDVIVELCSAVSSCHY